MPRIYLDNAATSWPKPESVYRAVEHYQREVGAPAGRSAYREAGQAERLVADARRGIAHLIGAEDSQRIVFTFNGTDALNLAIYGTLQQGDHVITSVVEHNSVLRPLRELEKRLGIEVDRVGCDGHGFVDPAAIRAAMRPRTKLVALIHASNVTGALQPVEETARIAHQQDALFLVDAAQSLGHVPVDVRQIGADLLAAPGHKGLLGPQGTGILYIAPEIEHRLATIRQGGTGTESWQDRQPESLPDKYEVGSHNVPGIVGLAAAVDFLRQRGMDAIGAHDGQLTSRLLEGLCEIKGVTLHGPETIDRRVGVVSITISGYDPQEVACSLDAAYSIQVRSGIHCAPLMHQALGTAEGGGTVRFSIGPFTTEEDIDAAIRAVGQIASAAVKMDEPSKT